MWGTFFFCSVKTRKRGRERGRKRQGGGEAWCLAVSPSHVSLAVVSPQGARGIQRNISKCFMEGLACCPSCPGPGQRQAGLGGRLTHLLLLYVCLSLCRSLHPSALQTPLFPTGISYSLLPFPLLRSGRSSGWVPGTLQGPYFACPS